MQTEMGKHKYHYLGETTVHLPTHGITAEGGDHTTVYETDEPIKNPDFKEVFKSEMKRKEALASK